MFAVVSESDTQDKYSDAMYWTGRHWTRHPASCHVYRTSTLARAAIMRQRRKGWSAPHYALWARARVIHNEQVKQAGEERE